MTPVERIAELEVVVRQQRAQIERLLSANTKARAWVQELEGHWAKESCNGGKQTCGDTLARKAVHAGMLHRR